LEQSFGPIDTIDLRSLPADALVANDRQAPAVHSAVQRVRECDVAIVATPIYQGAYSGLLKLFLDVLPQDALQGKIVLPIAVGGGSAHFLALDYAIKPVLAALGASIVLPGIFAHESQVVRTSDGGVLPDSLTAERIRQAAHAIPGLVAHLRPALRKSVAPTAKATTSPDLLRRRIAASLCGAWLIGQVPRAKAKSTDETVVRIGYQKYGTLTLLKARGTLDTRLRSVGLTGQWTEFPAGPQLLEALNVGSIDFGTTGEAPPIFAQAAGADLVYVAHQPPAPSAEALVVQKDSPIKSIEDLRGKRVAFNKGSNVHYFLVRALAHAGVRYSDIQTVFLTPADARAAFERGAVDAWAIWDPFLAAAEVQLGARQLADGTGLVSNHQFFLAERRFTERHADVVAGICAELSGLDQWAGSHAQSVVALLTPQLGLPEAVVEKAAGRLTYGIRVIDATVAAEQQRIADTFTELHLIPRPIRIADALPSDAVLRALTARDGTKPATG
jgi:sulfonate transport system substrate-binding protein